MPLVQWGRDVGAEGAQGKEVGLQRVQRKGWHPIGMFERAPCLPHKCHRLGDRGEFELEKFKAVRQLKDR